MMVVLRTQSTICLAARITSAARSRLVPGTGQSAGGGTHKTLNNGDAWRKRALYTKTRFPPDGDPSIRAAIILLRLVVLPCCRSRHKAVAASVSQAPNASSTRGRKQPAPRTYW